MSAASSKTPTRTATSPFDRDDADFIIRTSDHVDFSVHRLILSLGSSTFENMLSFPQPPDTDPIKPLVDVAENSQTMDAFLRILYPVADPEGLTLSTLHQILTAGVKYDVPAVVTAMRKALTQQRFIENDPLRSFAIACTFQMEAEAKAAAETAVLKLKDQLVAPIDCQELDDITAGAYFRLLKLNRTRKSTKRKPKSFHTTIDFTGIGPFCSPPLLSSEPSVNGEIGMIKSALPSLSFESDSSHPPDIILISCDLHEFRAHRIFIAFASPAMLSILELDRDIDGDGDVDNLLPVYHTKENAFVVSDLLQLCYPTHYHRVPFSHPGHPRHFLDVLLAARKYRLQRAEESLRAQWNVYAEKEPLRCYFAAAECGWEDEALMCARELIRQTDDVSTIQTIYIPEMETTRCGPYRALLRYVNNCCKAATSGLLLSLSHSPCTGMECTQRYPSSLTMRSECLPPWLYPPFTSMTNALRKKPHGVAVSVNSPAGSSVLTVVTEEIHPSSYVHYDCPLFKTRVLWATQFLHQYSECIDKAVSEALRSHF